MKEVESRNILILLCDTAFVDLNIFFIVAANLTLIGGKDLELLIYSPIQDMYLCFNRSRLVGRQMVSTTITTFLQNTKNINNKKNIG